MEVQLICRDSSTATMPKPARVDSASAAARFQVLAQQQFQPGDGQRDSNRSSELRSRSPTMASKPSSSAISGIR